VRRGLVCASALLIIAPAAGRADPAVTIQATPSSGAAPLSVTFTAGGEATSFHWDFGDGTSADGAGAQHTYSAGRWTVTLTATSSAGEPSTQTTVVTAYGLRLAARSPARYGRRAVFRGALFPPEPNIPVTVNGPRGRIGTARTKANGSYTVVAPVWVPGSYVATSSRGSSPPLQLGIVPRLATRLIGNGDRDSAYYVSARLMPASAGGLTIRITRGTEVVLDRTFESRARVRLDTRRPTRYVIRVAAVPHAGYSAATRTLRANVVLPRLAPGVRSRAIAQLGAQLRRLHYAAPAGATFDSRMVDAVYAFQKVNHLPRTGVVDARFWSALASSRLAQPRFTEPASHLEVNKGLQVLYVVRSSRVALIVPISTAGVPGTFTPVGQFAVYRKVVGFDPSPLGTLYDPLYFTGGYAIHGNPSVPPYPASHGCVRVPMWVAPNLFETVPYGETVDVY
jgi:PKD repeat protein/lipoprotein-anchoring transpeptidase ErfK/SrfK